MEDKQENQPVTVVSCRAMTEVTKMTVVPVVAVRVHSVAHIFRVPGGSGSPLAKTSTLFSVITLYHLTPGAQDLLKYSAAALTESQP